MEKKVEIKEEGKEKEKLGWGEMRRLLLEEENGESTKRRGRK